MPRRCLRMAVPGGGGVAFVTVDVRARTCACGTKTTDYVLCDWPLTGKKIGKTCDAVLCKRCALHVGPNRDLCPAHAHAEARGAELALEFG